MKTYLKITTIALLVVPMAAHAQLTGVKDLITAVGRLINPLVAILIGVALLAFFWGLAKFVFRVGGDEKAVAEGKRIMLWGLLALFIMVSVWGIIRLMQNELLLPLPPPSGNLPLLQSA